ncbi:MULTISPECIES: hypothetical protein [unclassified Bacillus (in: firmicutes)]|uniref:hypothetical protein n=1 Tax=unclassified Bacillus (in: firmicutes) TaxID=185979 RepID=UPI00300FBC49
MSAIPEMDFAFGSKNPTDVSQLASLGVGVSINKIYAITLKKIIVPSQFPHKFI